MVILIVFFCFCFYYSKFNYFLSNYLCVLKYFFNRLYISAVLAEAKYFGIDSMIPTLERMVRNQSNLKRADITKRLMTTTIDSKLRCQGLDISGADLSRLDLRYVNFKVFLFYYMCVNITIKIDYFIKKMLI